MGQVIPLSAEAEARPKPVGKISYEEYLEWYADTHAEWVDGEIIVGQPPTFEHQADSDFLTKLLGTFVDMRELGVLVSAPFQMRLKDAKSGREPDQMFISQEHLARIKSTYLDDENHYQTVFSGKEGLFESSVVEGFHFRVEWLWQRPYPKTLPLLKEMGVS